MRYYNDLILGEDMDDADEIIRLLDMGTPTFNIYLLCVEKTSNFVFEILSATEILKEINKNQEYIIIGLARGKKASIEMATDIITKWINDGNDFDKLKGNFMNDDD